MAKYVGGVNYNPTKWQYYTIASDIRNPYMKESLISGGQQFNQY